MFKSDVISESLSRTARPLSRTMSNGNGESGDFHLFLCHTQKHTMRSYLFISPPEPEVRSCHRNCCALLYLPYLYDELPIVLSVPIAGTSNN